MANGNAKESAHPTPDETIKWESGEVGEHPSIQTVLAGVNNMQRNWEILHKKFVMLDRALKTTQPPFSGRITVAWEKNKRGEKQPFIVQWEKTKTGIWRYKKLSTSRLTTRAKMERGFARGTLNTRDLLGVAQELLEMRVKINKIFMAQQLQLENYTSAFTKKIAVLESTIITRYADQLDRERNRGIASQPTPDNEPS